MECITDEGMNALGNQIKLGVLRLLRGVSFSDDSFDFNSVAGGFPQLQVFSDMSDLKVGKWKLGNSAMLRLQSLVCKKLDDLPNELWSLTALRKVQVRLSSDSMVHMLGNLEIKNEV
ncbi:hypothetical protein CR513_59235, partial [Mucuna pruriens]